MDWLFIPLGNLIQKSFLVLEKLNMGFNWLIILAGSTLTIWWMLQMLKHPKEKY